MNIVLTGSISTIGKPLTQALVQKGHSVTVISSHPERQKDIEALGAKAAIGTMQDVDFLTKTFTGADVVYLMETLDAAGAAGDRVNEDVDFIGAINQIGHNYKQAVGQSGVKHVVHLSSIGAHMNVGNGFLIFHHNVENILKGLPSNVVIKTVRPVGFYTNMLSFIPTIKKQGAIISNYGGDVKEPWVSPLDIATAIVEEMEAPFDGRTIRYIASDEVSPNEIAKVIGEAIGKPDLQWKVISDEQLLNNWLAIGMNRQIAEGFIQMQAGQGSGALYEDYNRNRPALGKEKIADFAKVFAAAYQR